MTARDFYNKEEKYSVFSKTTSTGISDDLEKITEFAEDYHQAKLKLLGIANVVQQSEPLGCDHPRSKRTYIGNNMLKCGLCGEEFK